MKTITTVVYEFDELTDEAKERARNWMIDDGGLLSQDAWEQTKEDAENIGLKIHCLDARRNNEGEFIGTALNTVEKILAEHGPSCETYKTAKEYEKGLRGALAKTQEEDSTTDDDYAYEEAEKEFLHSLLEDYRIMLEKDTEYLYSEENIDEMIRANGYTFTVDGKREG